MFSKLPMRLVAVTALLASSCLAQQGPHVFAGIVPQSFFASFLGGALDHDTLQVMALDLDPNSVACRITVEYTVGQEARKQLSVYVPVFKADDGRTSAFTTWNVPTGSALIVKTVTVDQFQLTTSATVTPGQ